MRSLRDSNNPNYAQLGMCRASRLEGIADAMMLRKLFVAWGNMARDAQVVTKLGGGLQPRQKPNGELHEDRGDTFGGVQHVCGKPACDSLDALMRRSQPEPQDDGNDSERDYAASTQPARHWSRLHSLGYEIAGLRWQVECKLLNLLAGTCSRDWNLVPLLRCRITLVLSSL